MSIIDSYIEFICSKLKISKPKVSYNTENFLTETTLAQCKSDGTEIFLKPIFSLTPDSAFAIAHELRHIWQIKTDYDKYFSNYKTADETDSNTYNAQIAEIDANAFSAIVMSDIFNIKPLWKGFSADNISRINNRISAILGESKK